jgi:predicted secreted protein
MRSFIKALFIVACVSLTACMKDKKNEVDKSLTGADTGKMTEIVKGERISLTLSNPGDGGYQFDDPQFNTSVLTLVDHSHKAGNPELIGNFGKDTWVFTANEPGTTTLEVTARRSWEANSVVSIFSGEIKVK